MPIHACLLVNGFGGMQHFSSLNDSNLTGLDLYQRERVLMTRTGRTCNSLAS